MATVIGGHVEKKEEAEEHSQKSQESLSLKDMLLVGYPKAKRASGKDVVLVIGVTGTGKSTTIAQLMGAPLEGYYKRGAVIARLRSEISAKTGQYPKIGERVDSETLYPEIWSSIDGTLLCDSPGFFDNQQGLNRKVAISINTELVVRSARSVKVVILASHRDLADKADSFLKVTDLLSKLFVDPSKVSAAALWVITKPIDPRVEVDDIYDQIHGKGSILEYLTKKSNTIRATLDKFYQAYKKGGALGAGLEGLVGLYSWVSSDSEKEKEELENLLRQSKVIKGISKDNLFVLKLFNRDDSLNVDSRQELLGRMKELPSIASSEFDFDTYEEARVEFRKLEESVMGEALGLFREKGRLQAEKAKCESEIARINKSILRYQKGKESSDKSVFKGIRSEEIASVKKEIDDLTKKKKKNKEKIELLEKKCTPLKSHKKEVVIYERNINEPAPWTWIKETLEYTGGIHITKKDEHWDPKKGNLSSTVDKPRGKYKATYVGDWMKPAKVNVTLYSQQKHIPGNKILFDNYSQRIAQLKAENKEIEQKLVDLKGKLDTLSKAKLDAEAAIKEEERLNDKKKGKENELSQNKATLLKTEQQIKCQAPSFKMFYDLLSLSFSKSRLAEEFQRLYELHIGNKSALEVQGIEELDRPDLVDKQYIRSVGLDGKDIKESSEILKTSSSSEPQPTSHSGDLSKPTAAMELSAEEIDLNLPQDQIRGNALNKNIPLKFETPVRELRVGQVQAEAQVQQQDLPKRLSATTVQFSSSSGESLLSRQGNTPSRVVMFSKPRSSSSVGTSSAAPSLAKQQEKQKKQGNKKK